ncbi:hypothetical protein OF83DRAFT_1073141, partial [Amylostereum chailletii]
MSVTIPFQHILEAYNALGYRVTRALHTQLGDGHRLRLQRNECTALLSDLQLHHDNTPPEEYLVISSSIGNMIEALNAAATSSSDLPDAPPPVLGQCVSTHARGHPRVNIDPQQFAVLSAGRARNTEIALAYACSSRTIRRRRLQFGLLTPGLPVYDDHIEQDGSILRTYHSGTASNLSALTDNELDQVILSIYHQFPSFGRRMIDGYLIELEERIPRQRILDLYRR